jgi:hypothetical protein
MLDKILKYILNKSFDIVMNDDKLKLVLSKDFEVRYNRYLDSLRVIEDPTLKDELDELLDEIAVNDCDTLARKSDTLDEFDVILNKVDESIKIDRYDIEVIFDNMKETAHGVSENISILLDICAELKRELIDNPQTDFSLRIDESLTSQTNVTIVNLYRNRIISNMLEYKTFEGKLNYLYKYEKYLEKYFDTFDVKRLRNTLSQY